MQKRYHSREHNSMTVLKKIIFDLHMKLFVYVYSSVFGILIHYLQIRIQTEIIIRIWIWILTASWLSFKKLNQVQFSHNQTATFLLSFADFQSFDPDPIWNKDLGLDSGRPLIIDPIPIRSQNTAIHQIRSKAVQYSLNIL